MMERTIVRSPLSSEAVRPLVGVIGGLGTRATVAFFNKVADLTPVKKEQDHLPMVIYNASQTPDRNQSIAGNNDACGLALADAARALERAGCDYLVMPCNAAHYYSSIIRNSVNIVFLSMVEHTCEQIALALPAGKVVGILSSDGTRQGRLYEKGLEAYGISTVIADDADQEDCMHCIYAAKEHSITDAERQRLLSISRSLVDQGAELIVAACTELPLLIKQDEVGVPVFDTSELLARLCIETSFESLITTNQHPINKNIFLNAEN